MARSMSGMRARRVPAADTHIVQHAVVAEVSALNPETRLYTLKPASEQPFAPSRAGSFIPITLETCGAEHAWPYALSSSPRESEQGIYRIVVNRNAGGFASRLIFDTWGVGERVTLGSPVEDDALGRLNGGDELIAIAGSVGVVPFHSIAKAIAEGSADFRLTLFYTANTNDELLFRDEWDEIAAQSNGRFSMVPVIIEPGAEGCERPPVTRAMIEQHADASDATFLVRGPAPLVAAMRLELAPLNLSRRQLRSAFSGDAESHPASLGNATRQITIRMGGQMRTIPARENETVLEAFEKAGLQPPANCRAGICGYCHATLLSGEYFLSSDEGTERKMHDRSIPFHPCCSYPASDMEIVLRPPKS